MVDMQSMIRSNQRLSSVKGPQVALFVGATSGIGLGILKEFARNAVNPRVYFVARNAAAAAPIADEIRRINAGAKVEVLEKNVSLVRDAGKVAEWFKTKESSLDLLCMSPGFFSLDGKQETPEGLEASLTTRYYSRIRILQLLTPLLNQSRSPHVLSVLAGGKEGKIHEDDLGLEKAANFSVSSSNTHSSTMMTLTMERFAAENPRISFVHAFPGLTSTPLFDGLSSGLRGAVLRYAVAPVVRLFARTITDAGRVGLYEATNARFSVDDGMVPLEAGETKAERTKGGVFLVNQDADSVNNEKVLQDLRERGVDKKVWEHTVKVFDSVS